MKKAILMGVPHHNNLGDHAITIAEKKYIEDNFTEYKYFEISEETIEECIYKITDYIEDEDIIFLHGGGNLGDEYLYVENGRRKVIELLPNNRIIIFPQTIYFSDTKSGKEELEKTKEIYSKHKNLTIIARESTSFEIMKKEFPNNRVIQTPDIVLYLDETKSTSKRKGLLFIFRGDIEANVSTEERLYMENIAKEYFKQIEFDDTAKGPNILEKDREKKLEEMLEKYRKSELVITDRLHGMIFAAITSTPCISLDNYNHKIKACSETLRGLDYIRYIENANEIEENIKYLLNNKFKKYDNSFALKEFKKIRGGI